MIAVFAAIPVIAGGVAVIAKLFSGDQPPPVLRAEMGRFSVDHPVFWGDFQAHNRTLLGANSSPAGHGLTMGAVTVRRARYVVAQSPPANTDPEPTDTGPAAQPTDTGPAAQPTDTGPAAQPSDTGPAAQPTDTGPAAQPTDTGPAAQPTDASPTNPHIGGASTNLTPAQQGQVRHITDEITKVYRAPAACQESVATAGCRLPDNFTQGPLNGGPYVSIRNRDGDAQIRTYNQLAVVLRHARTASRATGSHRREIVGASVAFTVRLVGFAGHTANVVWSLYGRGHTHVPPDWEPNREVGPVTAASDDDSREVQFFVPLPARRGKYYFVLRVLDEHGDVRARGASKTFR